jgi:nucleoid-associated protein Lsr2
MAQKVISQLVDDLDGADLGDKGETVNFALDGRSYEIDLSGKNAKALRDALAKYIAAGRRASGGRRTRRGSGGSSDAKQVRDWAKSQGMEVPDRGRIPANIREAYDNR